MRSTLKRFLITLLTLSLAHAKASWVTPLSSGEEKKRVFSITSKNREDTRIDYNQDKKIDYWKIKKDTLLVEAYYENKKAYFHIRKFDPALVKERLVVQDGNSLRLIFATNRKQKIFHYSSSETECVSQKLKSVSSILEDLQKTTIDVQACVQNFTSQKCFGREINQSFTNEIGEAVANVFKIPDNSPKENNKGLTCFKDPQVKKLFIERFGDKAGEIEFEKALIGLKNSIITFSKKQDASENSEEDAVIRCVQTGESNPKPPMKISENGQIQILIKKDGEIYSSAEIEQQLFHENLHSSSVTDESLTQAITDLCYKNKVTVMKPLETPQYFEAITSERIPITINGIAQSNIAQSEKNPVAISTSVETPLPPPTNASPVDMNRVAAIESTERVQSISNSQTSGIVRMAEGVLAATPAVASTGTLAKGISTGSSSSRLPASDYSSSPSASKNKSPAAELIAKNRSKGLKPGEYIKEEIDLTKQVSAASTRVTTNAGSKAATAAFDRNSKTAAPVQPADESAEFAGSAAGGGSGRSSSASISPSSGGGGQRRPQQRGTAAMGSASAQPVYGSAREEVVSVLSTNSYREAQRSLKDKNFLNKLKESKVTVYDFNGNTYGATKGEIVFVDQGDRFVREK